MKKKLSFVFKTLWFAVANSKSECFNIGDNKHQANYTKEKENSGNMKIQLLALKTIV